MRTQLVSIPTDTAPLEGVLHEPDSGKPAGAVLLFHGNTMNFYVGAPRFLPPKLTRLGLACLAFNRRGHALAPKIRCPVLCIRGDKEDVHRYPAEEFQRAAGGPCQVEIISDCDHFYNGRESHVAGIVSLWLAEKLGLRKA